MKLSEFIQTYHNNNKAQFAKHQHVLPQQVTKWLKMDCIVVSGVLYSPRRELKPTDSETMAIKAKIKELRG